MYSMTGYGSGISEENGRKITVEIKAVNHRFLDLSVKLPKILNKEEEFVRSTLKERLCRGHLDIYINYQSSTDSDYEISPNAPLIAKYLKAATDISSEFGINNDLTVSKLFEIKDILVYEETEPETGALHSLLSTALNNAIDSLIAMRENEGAKITADLNDKLNNIEKVVAIIKEYAPQQIENYRVDLLKRVKDVLGDVAVNEEKLMNEVVFYADKVAVDEEFTRLFAHIAHFREIVASKGAVGRQLDFIVQEMNREANTIGSKCNDIKIANHVVSLKTDIEKVREQAQNIE